MGVNYSFYAGPAIVLKKNTKDDLHSIVPFHEIEDVVGVDFLYRPESPENIIIPNQLKSGFYLLNAGEEPSFEAINDNFFVDSLACFKSLPQIIKLVEFLDKNYPGAYEFKNIVMSMAS